jgi:hypothetical protein
MERRLILTIRKWTGISYKSTYSSFEEEEEEEEEEEGKIL